VYEVFSDQVVKAGAGQATLNLSAKRTYLYILGSRNRQLAIFPGIPTTNDDLEIHCLRGIYTTHGYWYRWYKNNVLQSDLNDSLIVPSSRTGIGETWRCDVYIDGAIFGQDSVTIQQGAVPTATNTPVKTNTPTATRTPTSTNTATSTATRTPTFTNTATSTATRTPTNTYTVTLTPTITNTPTKTLTPLPTNTNKPCMLGDSNCDGNITPSDALLAFQIYLRLYVPTGDEICDVNCAADIITDGNITPGDALCIFRTYLRMPCN